MLLLFRELLWEVTHVFTETKKKFTQSLVVIGLFAANALYLIFAPLLYT